MGFDNYFFSIGITYGRRRRKTVSPWLQLDDKSLAAATAVPVPVKWRRRRKTISPWLQLDEKSFAATTAVAVAVKYWRAHTTSPIR